MHKKTVVIGASTKLERYSNKLIRKLQSLEIEVVGIGNKSGKINDLDILTEKTNLENVHTVSLYIRPSLQAEYYSYIFSLNPKRIIFNPGTENIDLFNQAKAKGIEVLNACSLVMLSIKDY